RLLDQWNDRKLNIAAIVCAIVLPPLATGWILPKFIRSDTRETARLVRESFGDRPYCFYGPNQSLTLCFNLRHEIPTAEDDAQLNAIVGKTPDVIIITIGKDHRPATAPSNERFEKLKTIQRDEQVWEFYRPA